MLAALCCIATLVIRIPAPMGGYVNLGDCVVLLCAWMLGPLFGAAAAGVGSALADVLSGYAQYAPATFVIKAAMAVLAGFVLSAFKTGRLPELIVRVIGAFVAEGIMVLGYLVFEGLLLSYGAGALANIPGNLVQAVFSIAAALTLFHFLMKSPALRRLLGKGALDSDTN